MKKILLLLTTFCLAHSTLVFAETQPVKHKHKHTTHNKHVSHKHKRPHRTPHTNQQGLIAGVNFPADDSIDDAESGTIPKDYVNQTSVRKEPKLYSFSAVALNAKTGEIMVSKNPNTQLPIASITKLMTAVVVLDSGVNLDEYVTITSNDVDVIKNTSSRLKVGMQFRRRDLLLLALMSSENRAAYALSSTTFKGGRSIFIRKMNEKAKDIGMNNTQFYEPTGLYHLNKSTALDLSKLVQTAYTYSKIRHDTTTKNADVMFGPRYTHRYINSDSLVRANKTQLQIEISKTGFINEAGHCLALYSIVNNKPIVMVFLNSSGKSGRIIDAITVKNYVQSMKGY